jgi:hypothetical protein
VEDWSVRSLAQDLAPGEEMGFARARELIVLIFSRLGQSKRGRLADAWRPFPF